MKSLIERITVRKKSVGQEKLYGSESWRPIYIREALEAILLNIESRNPALYIRGVDLRDLPEVFELSWLKSLEITPSESGIRTGIPDGICQLVELTSLNIRGWIIDNLPKEFNKLIKLVNINFTDSHLEKVPEELWQLTNLETLDLSYNRITNLPPEIRQIAHLEELDLRDNRLTELPIEIVLLTNLKKLDLRNNDLRIPPEILERIDSPKNILDYYLFTFADKIRGLESERLAPILKHLKARLETDVEHGLELEEHSRTLLNLLIKTTYAVEPRPLNEIKLLIVGQGSVGKTSLVERILHDRFNQNQTKTEGISINQWQVNGSRESEIVNRGKSDSRVTSSDSQITNPESSIKLNIWDFGGQEIMHATHQFFLTKRSLYLLVLDARLTQEENRVEYWLKIIQSFGGESPVLIVGNKTDQHPLDIDRTGLGKKYPNIVGILETSAATGAGIAALKVEIAKQVDTLPHVRDLLPETWFTVKSKLEELGRGKNFITQDEYLGLCDTNDIKDETSQHTLIGFLHDLGVILHFQDDPRLEALGILKPQWVTNGVYKILNSHELFQNQGTLTLPILNKTLNPPEYPSNKRLFIVDMMKKFELCHDIEPDKSFLIPDLLPKDEPFTGEWDEALTFEIHYNVLPSSIISRFIVRMNAFVHKTIWRSGVVLKRGDNMALVKADTEDKKIYIWVSGNGATRRDFLSMIRGEFEAIHTTIAKIEATEKVPHPQHSSLVFDYKELLQFESDKVPEFPKSFEGKTIMVYVGQLLDGIADPSRRQQDLAQSQLERDVNQQQDTRKTDTEKRSETKANKETTNPWRSGSFYLISFILGIAAYFAAKSYGLSGYDILAAFGVGISAMLIIGILQLRNDEKLEDASFVTLIREFLKRFPFFRKSKDD